MEQKSIINKKLARLSKSKFRSSFSLNQEDKDYIKEKGLSKIEEHALDFLNSRIKTKLKNDGKQTPFKGHPVFKAQHATGICCRKCIRKWHKIPREKTLEADKINYLKEILMTWIRKEMKNKR